MTAAESDQSTRHGFTNELIFFNDRKPVEISDHTAHGITSKWISSGKKGESIDEVQEITIRRHESKLRHPVNRRH